MDDFSLIKMSWNINCARLLCHRQIFDFPSCCSIIGMQLLAHIALARQMPFDLFFNRFETLPLSQSFILLCFFFFFFISFHPISNEIQWNKNQIISFENANKVANSRWELYFGQIKKKNKMKKKIYMQNQTKRKIFASRFFGMGNLIKNGMLTIIFL